MSKKPFDFQTVISIVGSLLVFVFLLFLGITGIILVGPERLEAFFKNKSTDEIVAPYTWIVPDIQDLPPDPVSDEIKYGRDLIVHTSQYLGPAGKVKAISNGMNCQNCHLEGGTKPFGNNYSAVASTFPKFRPRSGSVESIEKRVNDCLERSLNGTPLPHDGREMRAIVAYLKWLGKDVPKNITPQGAGLIRLDFPDHPADTLKGQQVYEKKCASCHGKSGQGQLNQQGNEWIYPPLWGNKSYNDGAGLYRLSRFAGYVKANMPIKTTYNQPQLTDEEAWNVAAYVNTLPRPKKDTPDDWPDIATKPVDFPFGPFTDTFSASQHKLGPFKPIQQMYEHARKGSK